jgi:hypothetical protein
MSTNLSRYEADLGKLVEKGRVLLLTAGSMNSIPKRLESN